MIIRSGSKWLCLEDVKMNVGFPWITYKKGKVYTSENNFCITDENSNKEHRWIDEEKIRRYFKFLPKNRGFTAQKKNTERKDKPAYLLNLPRLFFSSLINKARGETCWKIVKGEKNQVGRIRLKN